MEIGAASDANKFVNPNAKSISPTSKVTVCKIDVVSCNGNQLNNVELGAVDLENIWTDSLLRELSELSGYTSTKTKNNTEIRIQYQLQAPLCLRSIAYEAEFTHERAGPKGVEILKCRVIGLNDIRLAKIGEKVRVTVLLPNFDITPDQIVEWVSKYGLVQEGHRYRGLPFLIRSEIAYL